MSNYASTVIRNSVWGFLAQFAMRVLSFGFNVLVIRQLGAEDFGQYAAIGAFGTVFLFVADLGLSPYAVREFARLRDQDGGWAKAERLWSQLLWLRIMLAFLSAGFSIGAALVTGRPTEMVVGIVVNGLFLWLYGIQGASETTLAGFEKMGLTSSAKVINQLIFVVAGGLALWLGYGYMGLIVANLLGGAAMMVVCWRGVRTLALKLHPPELRAWGMLLRAAWPFGLLTLALGLSYRFDTVLLNVTRGDAETGWYNTAYSLIFSLVMVSNVINTSLYPTFTRQAARSPERVPAISARLLRYLLAVALPLAVGGWVLVNPLVIFLYGPENAPAAPALAVLIWVLPFMYASEFLGYVVLVTGREKRVAQAVLVSTTVNVIANAALVPVYGYEVAAVMTVVTEIVLVSQHVHTLWPIVRQIEWGKVLVRPALAAGLMGAALALWPTTWPVPLAVLAGAAVYGLAGWAVGAFSVDDLRYVRRARRDDAGETLPVT